MSELSMGEEGLGLKPGLAELKLEPGIHRFNKFPDFFEHFVQGWRRGCNG